MEIITDSQMGYLYENDLDAVENILKVLKTDKEYYENYLIKFSQEYNNIPNYKSKILEGYKK